MTTSKTLHVTTRLPIETVNDINVLADRHGITASAVLQKAVRTEMFCVNVEHHNGKLLVERADGTLHQIVQR